MKEEQERRQLQEEHDKKTQKMAALLEAAATGRLWSERGGNTSMAIELQDIEDDRNEQSSSTARKLVRLVLMMKLNVPFVKLSGRRTSNRARVGAMRHARGDSTVCTFVFVMILNSSSAYGQFKS